MFLFRGRSSLFFFFVKAFINFLWLLKVTFLSSLLWAVLSKQRCIILNSSCIFYSIHSAFNCLLFFHFDFANWVTIKIIFCGNGNDRAYTLNSAYSFTTVTQSGATKTCERRSKHLLMSNGVPSIEHYSIWTGWVTYPNPKNKNPQTKLTYNPDNIKYGLASNKHKRGLYWLQYVLYMIGCWEHELIEIQEIFRKQTAMIQCYTKSHFTYIMLILIMILNY